MFTAIGWIVALGVNLEGRKELLGLWLGENEGAKFSLTCLTDLKNRGLQDIFVACIDGLGGFAEAIHTKGKDTCSTWNLQPTNRKLPPDRTRKPKSKSKDIITDKKSSHPAPAN